MTAKEMFKKLGYKEKFDNLRYLVYEKVYKERIVAIHFDKKYKKVSKFKIGLSIYYQERRDVEISLKELQAINKQVEELGWNK